MSAQPANTVPEGHVTIEIDGRELHAPKGAMIIQVADRAGIAIPRFCYHEKLAIAANCRMCMVEVEMGGRPMPKPAPACATPVADGMKVMTQSSKALSAQRNAMEFLLINHPLDCPVCDQGGECELQDLSLGYGRSVSRFVERKRVVADEDIGPLVGTEMTRCIHCTRCVRVMAEVAGTHELGGMYRGDRMQIGTWSGRPLESELSGNVIDVCPVGALTNKPFQFRARAWELLARESIGYHDAIGSNLWLHTRRGEVLRCVPRDNEAINECWLSDRDRWSSEGLNSADRLKAPLVRTGDGTLQDADWNDAVRAASERLREAPQGGLGALMSPGTSNEEGFLLSRLVRGLGSHDVDFRLRQSDYSDAPAGTFTMPVEAISHAGAIVLVGCNPRTEVPVLGARIRRATQRGGSLHALNPVDFDFDYGLPLANHVVAGAGFAGAVEALAAGEGGDAALADIRAALAAAGGRGVILVGESVQLHPQAAVLRAALQGLARATGSHYNEIPAGANAIGLAQVGALPQGTGRDAGAMLATPPHTLVLYGCELEDFADPQAALAAIKGASQVIAFASYDSELLREHADVVLPIGLLPEIEATLVNADGAAQVLAAGARLPGDARAGWRVLRALGSALALEGFEFLEAAEVRAAIAAAPKPAAVATRKGGAAPVVPAGSLVRVATTGVYAADSVVRRSPPLQAHPLAAGARVRVSPDDAARIGLVDGGNARVGGSVLPVEVSVRVPAGVAWVERGHAATAMLPPCGAPLEISKA